MEPSSIRKIQREYFALIKSHFVSEVRDYLTSGVGADKYVWQLMKRESAGLVVPSPSGSIKSALWFKVRNMLEDVRAFWRDHADDAFAWIRDSNALCLCASRQADTLAATLRRGGLYFDTVCVADPLYLNPDSVLSTQMAKQAFPLEQRYLRDYFCVLDLEPVFLADCEPPLAVLYAPYHDQDMGEDVKIEMRAVELAHEFLGPVLGAPSKQSEWSRDTINQIPEATVRKTLSEDPLFAALRSTGLDIARAMELIIVEELGEAWEGFDAYSFSEKDRLIFSMMLLVQRQIYGLLRADRECAALPMTRYVHDRGSWSALHRLNKRAVEDQARQANLTQEDAVAFAFENEELHWLSNASIDELVRLREVGFMEEMRSFFRVSAGLLRRTPTVGFEEICRQVANQLNERLAAHSNELERKADEYRRSARLSAGSLVVSAGLGIASLVFPAIAPLAVGATIYSILVGGKSVKDIVQQRAQHNKATSQLTERPIALLFDLHERGGSQ